MNPWSWNTNATVIYFDQPIGTGFSTVSSKATNNTYPTTIQQSTQQVYNAIVHLYDSFPTLANNEWYLTGESYAGKLAISFIDIYQSILHLFLKGLLIMLYLHNFFVLLHFFVSFF